MSARRVASRILAALRGWWRRGYPNPFVVVGDGVAPFIRLTCDGCREDRFIHVDHLSIVRYAGGAEWIGYRCPACAHDGMVQLPAFLAGHARRMGLKIIEMPEPDQVEAPALTEDDLIAFGLALHKTQETTA